MWIKNNKPIIVAVIIGGVIVPGVLHPLNVTILGSGKDILVHIIGALCGLFIGLILKKVK